MICDSARHMLLTYHSSAHLDFCHLMMFTRRVLRMQVFLTRSSLFNGFKHTFRSSEAIHLESQSQVKVQAAAL